MNTQTAFSSWYETPFSPRKKQKEKKTQNTFIQLSFDLCISPLPHLQWLQWGQCVNVVIKLCSMDIRNLPEPMH